MTSNLNDNSRGGTFCLSKAGLAIGSTATGIAIAAPNGAGVDYSIESVAYHKADVATAAITAAEEQAVATTCLYLVCLDSSGTVSTVKGVETLTADLTNGVGVLTWPVPLSGTCPIGATHVVTDATHTFTAGTTAHNATGVTTTYIDLFSVPTHPRTS